jgi:23S rRNA (guanosine2251-2'-O)-methyltransferase
LEKESNEIIFGRNPIIEALQAKRVFDKIFMADNIRGEVEKEIRKLTNDQSIPLAKVPPIKLNQLARNLNHQGIIGFISPIEFQNLQNVIAHCFDQGLNPLIVVLEGVSDVRNLAAIARSAHVFGAHAVVITSKKSAAINGETVKVSAGAILKIPVCRERSMITIIETLQSNGIKVVATSLDTNTMVSEADLTQPLALVMGSEGDGITLETSRAVDINVKIPQASDFDSLNVSVAAGIVLYEAYRQRGLKIGL